MLLLAEGLTLEAVAHTLGCSRASVYAWAAAWRQDGVAGLREGDHGGGQVKLDAAGEAVLAEPAGHRSPDARPSGHGLDGAAVAHGTGRRPATRSGERTVRRALHRLGYRWKRPRYVLGRPDPAYAEKRGP